MLEVVIGNRLRDISRSIVSKIETSNNLLLENFVVVPDRFSLIAEKMIFEELGITSTFNIQVLGISKLARIVLAENDISLNVLSPNECKLMLLKILKESSLQSFHEKGFMLAEELLKIISQLKSSNITSLDFSKAVEHLNNEKLNDIAKVFGLYEEALQNKYDQNDLLSKFSEVIDEKLKHNYFFVEFENFTEQGKILLEKIILNAKKVVIGALLPDKQNNYHNYDNDILFKINKICRENGIEFRKTFVKNNISVEQEHILRNLYGFRPKQIDNKNIYLFSFSTPEEEIKNIAKIINFEVYNNGKRFLDFNVLMPSIESKSLFEKVFSEHNIPFFMDSGVLASNTKTVEFIFSAFDFLENESAETFLPLLKNFYSRVNFEQYCDVDNYISKTGVFELKYFCDKNEQVGEDVASFCKKLTMLKKDFRRTSNCEDYVNLVEKLLDIFEVESITQDLIKSFSEKNELKLEKIYQQIYERILGSLEILKNSDILLEFKEFVEILKKILDSKEIYSVPTALDCVFIGDATRSYFEERDFLFVCQAQQGKLPVVLKDFSLLSDNNIEELSLDVSPTVRLINKRNKFRLMQSLTLARDKVFISYSSTALGEKEEPSDLLAEIQKIFAKDGHKIGIYSSIFDLNAKEKLLAKDSFLDIQNEIEFNNLIISLIVKRKLDVKTFKEIFQGRDFNLLGKEVNEFIRKSSDELFIIDLLLEINDPQNKEKISDPRGVYFKNNKISASQIQQFYQCPFRHFFTYGLKLKENEICEFDGRDIGNYFHGIAENFLKIDRENENLDIEKTLDELVDLVYKDERLRRLRDCPNNKHMVAKLKSEAKMLIEKIQLEQKWSDFKILSTETLFSYKLNEEGFRLTGRIDRVDTSGEYFRVIDYKSGDVKQSLAGVYYGIELQLFIYLLAMKRELSLKPIAGLYLPVGSDFVNNKSLKKLVLSGFILAESYVLKRLDKRFSPSVLRSDIISVTLSSKSGEDNLIIDGRRRKNMFSDRGFSSVLKYTEALVHKSLSDILTGNISASPLKSKNYLPCKHCPYFSVCSYLGDEDNPRKEVREMKESDFIKIEGSLNGKKI